MKSQKKSTAIAITALIIVLALSLGLYFGFGSETNRGAKSITLQVVQLEGEAQSFNIKTQQEYLGAALTEEELIVGEQDEYGLFIKSVRGITADDSKSQWWKLTKGGELVMTGVDKVAIADGDKYELTLTEGYEDF